MQKSKKAFSFVELIVVLSILVLISVVGINMLNLNKQKANNTKIEAGVKTINNSFLAYMQEKQSLPMPGGNNNYFKADSGYAHSGSENVFGVYGSITEKVLPKKYLDHLPLDPFSNHYFSYGKTLDNKNFEVASIIRDGENPFTKLEGNYPGEYGPISLIREYNGPYFVSNGNKIHLPYNPDEHIITAKIGDINGEISVNGSIINGTKQLKTGDQITSGANSNANIYFSDGSISSLLENSELTLSEMSYKNAEHNLLTKIKIYLREGSIFTKATSLNDGSDFEIYTSDTTSAVRGTIFYVETNNIETSVIVLKGSVEVYQTPKIDDLEKPESLEKTNPIKIVEEGKKVNIKNKSSNETPYSESQMEELIEQKDNINYLSDNLPEGKTLEQINRGSDEEREKLNCESGVYYGVHYEEKDFYSMSQVDFGESCEKKKETFKCNDGNWENKSGESKKVYKFTACVEGDPINCNSGKTDEGHYYENIDHGLGAIAKKEIDTIGEGETKRIESVNVSCNNGVVTKLDNKKFEIECREDKYKKDGLRCVAKTIEINVLCGGEKGENSLAYMGNEYKKTKNLATDEITGETKVWSYSENDGGECSFKCKKDYIWNQSENKCKPACALEFLDLGCVDKENNIDRWTLFGYAPYNEAGDVDMYLEGEKAELSSQRILNNTLRLPNFCEDGSVTKRSFCKIGDISGVYIDEPNNDDYISYDGLNLDGDFIIEINARIPDDDEERYLIHSGRNIMLYVKNGKLNFENQGNGYKNPMDIKKGQFNKIFLIREGNRTYTATESFKPRFDTKSNIKSTINKIYIGALNIGNSYHSQLDDIINYVKIYKK